MYFDQAYIIAKFFNKNRALSEEEKRIKKKMTGCEDELWPRVMGKVSQWQEREGDSEEFGKQKLEEVLTNVEGFIYKK